MARRDVICGANCVLLCNSREQTDRRLVSMTFITKLTSSTTEALLHQVVDRYAAGAVSASDDAVLDLSLLAALFFLPAVPAPFEVDNFTVFTLSATSAGFSIDSVNTPDSSFPSTLSETASKGSVIDRMKLQ